MKLHNQTAPPPPLPLSSAVCCQHPRLQPRKAKERSWWQLRGTLWRIMMLVNMWDAFCSLAFACGGFSRLFLSGGRCVRVCMCGGSICACCVRTSGRNQGRRSLFSIWFPLVHWGTLISDGLPLEYCWPGACVNLCDLLVFLPSSILRIVSPHLSSARLLPGVSLIPTEIPTNTYRASASHPHTCTHKVEG